MHYLFSRSFIKSSVTLLALLTLSLGFVLVAYAGGGRGGSGGGGYSGGYAKGDTVARGISDRGIAGAMADVANAGFGVAGSMCSGCSAVASRNSSGSYDVGVRGPGGEGGSGDSGSSGGGGGYVVRVPNSQPVGDIDSVGRGYGRYRHYDADGFGERNTDDNTTCSYFSGWVLDRDNILLKELAMRIDEVDVNGNLIRTVVDDAKASAPTLLGTTVPSLPDRYYWNTPGGGVTTYHSVSRYRIPTPLSLQDGLPHLVKIYVEDVDRYGNTLRFVQQPMNDVTVRNPRWGRTPYIYWMDLWSFRQSSPYVGSAINPVFKVQCPRATEVDVAIESLYFTDTDTGRFADIPVFQSGKNYQPYIVVRNNSDYVDDIEFEVDLYGIKRTGTVSNMAPKTSRIVPLTPVTFNSSYVTYTYNEGFLPTVVKVTSTKNGTSDTISGVRMMFAETNIADNTYKGWFAVIEPDDFPQCSDGIDNDDPEDALADAADPGCWTDPNDGSTYNPYDDNEAFVAPPVCTVSRTANSYPRGDDVTFNWNVTWFGQTGEHVRVVDESDNVVTTLLTTDNSGTITFEAPATVGTYRYRLQARNAAGDVSWCAPQVAIQVVTAECSDGVDNSDPEDTLADRLDPGCWTDPTDPTTYDASDNDEVDANNAGLLGVAPDISITANGIDDRTTVRPDQDVLIEWDPNGYTTPSSPAANTAGIRCTLEPAPLFSGLTEDQKKQPGSITVRRDALTIFSYECTSPDADGQKAWQGGEDKFDEVSVEVIPQIFES